MAVARCAPGCSESPTTFVWSEEIEVSDNRWQPDQLLIDDELMEIVEQGIRSMSEKLRSVLLLHDKEDMQYDEIAELLEVPIGTVKSRLFLARAHLQNVVRQYMGVEAPQ
jgi:RNA polymerase sigma-70 factor, ECF subfamily